MNKNKTVAKLERLAPDKLRFDPGNPRLGEWAKGKSQIEIQKLLIGEPNYASELVDSLVENGFIDYEPLVARRKGDKFLLVEGNRRLAAIREIRSDLTKYPTRKSDLEKVPVLVFPDRPDEKQQEEMRVYLGIRHLLGFREWPPLSKALFLERETQHGGLQRVLKELRISKQQARRFLVPYRLLKAANKSLPGEDFWMLGEALQRSGIKKYLQLEVDPETLDIKGFGSSHLWHLLNDLYGPKIPGHSERDVTKRIVEDTRDLSRLARVLASVKATMVLRAGASLEDAEILIDTREESLVKLSRLTKRVGRLVKKLVGAKSPEGRRMLKAYKQFDAAVKGFVSHNA